MSYKPRIRSIKPELWTDQDLQLLPVHARLLFIGLISNADDDGRLEGHPGIIRSRIFPADADVTNRKVEGWLNTLDQHELVALYTHDSRPYIEVVNWDKHQRVVRPTPSTLPKRNGSHG